MRHRKHNHLLGVKTAHRTSLIANLSCSLIENGRIKTTLAKARALRPSIEKAITLAKKAHSTDDVSKKLHFRRQAIARLRSKSAVKKLFDELVDQFIGRNGGYTRIYKLAIPRLGDAADMGIIEFVEEIQKKKTKKKRSSKKSKSSPKTQADEKSKVTEEDTNVDSQPKDLSTTEPESSKEQAEPSSTSSKADEDNVEEKSATKDEPKKSSGKTSE